MSSGFEKVSLARPWLGNAVGAEVEVDPERAKQLRKDRFIASATDRPAPEPATAARDTAPASMPDAPRES